MARWLAILGLQGVLLGLPGQDLLRLHGPTHGPDLPWFRYTRASFVAFVVFVVGVGLLMPLVVRYFQNDLSLPELSTTNHLAVTGLFLIVAGFSLFVFTLLIHAAAIATGRGASAVTGRQRSTAFAQGSEPSRVDRLGRWLSTVRMRR